ncbi:MAG: hypothetical protein MJ061_04075, partial [Mailhella sp.]|nr:hypothetical protein [Mailhella sp.]
MNRRTFLKILSASGIAAAGAAAGGCAFMRGEKFGSLPEGEALARIAASPNCSGGQFRYPAKYAVTVHERAGALQAGAKLVFSS